MHRCRGRGCVACEGAISRRAVEQLVEATRSMQGRRLLWAMIAGVRRNRVAAQCSTDEEQRLSGCDVWLPANCEHAAKDGTASPDVLLCLCRCPCCCCRRRRRRWQNAGNSGDQYGERDRSGLKRGLLLCYCSATVYRWSWFPIIKTALAGKRYRYKRCCSAGGDE